jgi:hypothetical protein
MAKGSHRSSFAAETGYSSLIGSEVVPEEFDRDRTSQNAIQGRVHLRHAALAEKGQKFIAATEQLVALLPKNRRIPHEAII